MALSEILKSGRYEVAALLTTVTKDYDRISMHGVRRALLQQQAESLGLDLEEVFITKDASNAEYESCMAERPVEVPGHRDQVGRLRRHLPGGSAKVQGGKARLAEYASHLPDLEERHKRVGTRIYRLGLQSCHHLR